MPWIDANGKSLRYRIEGEGPQTLVLLHELGGALESWDEVAPHFAGGHRVLRYDMRGHGLSEKICGSLAIEDAVADLTGLLDALAIVRPVAFAGVAVGAGVGLQAAAMHPARFRALIAMSPAVGIPSAGQAGSEALAQRIEKEGMRRFVVEDMLVGGYPPVLRRDMGRFARFRGIQLANDPESYAATMRMLASCDVAPVLPQIACPVLYLAGAHDVRRPPSFVAGLVGLTRNARMDVLDTGHFMPMQSPDLVVAAISSFLAGLASAHS